MLVIWFLLVHACFMYDPMIFLTTTSYNIAKAIPLEYFVTFCEFEKHF